MDPLFERRELVRNVRVDSRFLQRNMEASLTAQLRMRYESRCVPEGYIQPRSVVITEHSLGRANLIAGGLDYVVKFQADVCFPHPGQIFRLPVLLMSKIGAHLHEERSPIKVLLPRDLHIGMASFEDLKEGETVEFEVVGTRFQQGDDSILVLGKLRNTIQPAVEKAAETAAEEAPVIAAPVGEKPAADGERRMVTVDVSATKSADQVRRKRIKTSSAVSANEQGS